MAELFEKGEFSYGDLIKANFGVRSPNGLDVADGDVLDQSSIKLTNLLHDRKHWVSAHKSGFSLSMNGLVGIASGAAMLYTGGFSLLAQIIIPIVAGEAAGLSAAAVMGLFGLGGSVDPCTKDLTISYNPAMKLANVFFGKANVYSDGDTLAHEGLHIGSKISDNAGISNDFDVNKVVDTDAKTPFGQYLAREMEVNARIYTILSRAYMASDKMPVSRPELYACLEAQGLSIPESLIESMSADDEFIKARDFYAAHKSRLMEVRDNQGVGEIKDLLKSMTPEQQQKFWIDELPRLYGNTLELLGDKRGGMRMGFPFNQRRRELFLVSCVNAKEYTKKTRDAYLVRAQVLANQMEKHEALGLLATVINQSEADQSKGIKSIGLNSGYSNTPREYAIQALLRRGDITEEDIKAMPVRTVRTSHSKDTTPADFKTFAIAFLKTGREHLTVAQSKREISLPAA
jgi:hypothetical protein